MAQKYNEASIPFLDWLTAINTRFDLLSLAPLKHERIQNTKKELETIQNEINSQARNYASVEELGKELVNTSQQDSNVIEVELDSVKKRWQTLLNNVQNARDQLKRQENKLEDFEDGVNIMKEVFNPCEAMLSERKPLGLSEEARKQEINKIDQFLTTIEERKPVLEKIPNIYEDLATMCFEDDPEAAIMKESVDNINKKNSEIPKKLQELKETLMQENVYLAKLDAIER